MKITEKTTGFLLRRLSLCAAVLVISVSAAKAADYPTTILGDDPNVYYRFSEMTNGDNYPSDAVDSTGNGFTGGYNYNGEDTSPLLGLPGIDTNSIAFKTYNGNYGDYGYVDVPNAAGLTPAGGTNGGAFSAELWVQPQASPGNGNWGVPFEVGQYPNGWNFYVSGIGEGNGNTSYFYLDMRPGVFQGFGNVPITFFQWYHLVLTFDGTNAVTYINGQVQVTNVVQPGGFVPASGVDGHIGSGQGVGWDPFIGGVDEFAFYTNVLTATQVSNHYTIGTNSFYVIPSPATVASEPVSLTNYSGTTATFSALGNGTAPLYFQWYTNGTAITGATANSYSLLAEYPQDNNLGFTVIVTNAYGSQTSTVATLTVQTNLNIVAPPQSVTRNVGGYAAFHVTANGALPIAYQWSVSIDGGNTFASILAPTNLTGANDTLWLSNVQLSNNGNVYSVTVSNPFGVSSNQASLSVQTRQDPPVPLTGYGAVVAGDNPVAYWRLDETNGTLAEDAVGTFDGAYTPNSGTITYGVAPGIPRTTDPGVNLANGATIQIPWAPELNSDTAWSVETWIQPSSLGANGGDYRVVLSSEYNEYPYPYNGWYLYQQPNGSLAFVPQPGNGFVVAGQMVASNWYHVVITDDTTNFNLYINGQLGSSFPVAQDELIPNGDGINPNGSAGLNGDDASSFVIGQRTDGAFNTFEGTVDDTAVYNYALTPQQIATHYSNTENYPTTVLANNPVVYYRFEETTNGANYPTVAEDSSLYGNNGGYNYNGEDTSPLLGLPGIDTNSILFKTYNGNYGDYGYVDVPNAAGLTPAGGTNGGAFSAELWVQPQASPGNGNWGVPFEVGQYPNGWNFYVSGIGEGNGNTSYFYLDMRPGVFQGFGNVPITFFQWYHLVLTFDGTNAVTYINGQVQATNVVPPGGFTPASGVDGHIGSGQGVGWDPFIGGVDEFAFYTNVLTAAEVAQDYKVGTNSFYVVPVPAAISTAPVSSTNYSGTSVTFSALGTGTAPLFYQWYTNGTAILGATAASYTLTAQYPIDNNLNLTVVVSNAFGSQTSSIATLTLMTNINVVAPPMSITRNVGSYAAFHVTADGALPITNQWSVSTNGGASFSNILGATNDTLWLSDVQLSQTGNMYSVLLSDPFGSVSESASLNVQPRQDPPVPLHGYGAIIAADSPVAYWRLDETNGTLAEDAVGTFDGTYTPGAGSITYSVPTGIPHRADPAVTLANGATVQVPWAPELNPDTAWSVETWIQPSSLGANGGDYRVVLSSEYNEYPYPYNGWYLYQQPSGSLAFVPEPGNGFVVAGQMAVSNWYHVVITDDTTNFNLYINGQLGSSFPVAQDQFIPNGDGINPNGSAGLNGDDASSFVIGQRTDGAFNTFEGTVDDTAVYNYALSPTQIGLHYADATMLTLVKSSTNSTLTWPVGVLQSSTNLSKGFVTVPGATSPYTNSASGPATYYRVYVP